MVLTKAVVLKMHHFADVDMEEDKCLVISRP